MLVASASVDVVIHKTNPTGPGRSSAPTTPEQSDQPAVQSRFRSARRSAMSKLLFWLRRGKTESPPTTAIAGFSRGGGGASKSGDGEDGGELGKTETRLVRHKEKVCSDDWPIATGSQRGPKGNKVIPMTAGIV